MHMPHSCTSVAMTKVFAFPRGEGAWRVNEYTKDVSGGEVRKSAHICCSTLEATDVNTLDKKGQLLEVRDTGQRASVSVSEESCVTCVCVGGTDAGIAGAASPDSLLWSVSPPDVLLCKVEVELSVPDMVCGLSVLGAAIQCRTGKLSRRADRLTGWKEISSMVFLLSLSYSQPSHYLPHQPDCSDSGSQQQQCAAFHLYVPSHSSAWDSPF
ncbi:unnamed protein product [Pleuronectes platessa]|uniref:Uncharacterized protein n=1 Tax=Pleuronectes platessa TaxID=8262 RepID=A0A9N7VFU9_PLEPL|nr:unnamed protein product [Pleuronectes platessa]